MGGRGGGGVCLSDNLPHSVFIYGIEVLTDGCAYSC